MTEQMMSPRDLTAHNARILLALIRRKGPLSVTGAADLLDCSRVSAALLMNRLKKSSLVTPEGGRIGGTGTRFGFNPRAAAAMGVDIRPGYLQILLTDLGGGILAEETVDTEGLNAAETAALIGERGGGILNRTSLPGTFLGAGVMIPGWVSDDGIVLNAGPLGWKDPVRFRDLLAGGVPFPVRLLNDANALVLAESFWGSLGRVGNLLYIENPDDIGGAFIDGMGALLTGENSLAMEVGKMLIHRDGRFWKVEEYLNIGRILDEQGMDTEELKRIFDSPEGESHEICGRISDAFGQIIGQISALLNPYAIMIRTPYIASETALDKLRHAALRHIRETPLKETHLLLPTLERSALGGACWAILNSPCSFVLEGVTKVI